MRLVDDMRREADSMFERASGYTTAGDRATARGLVQAATMMRTAATAVLEATAAEGEALERAREA